MEICHRILSALPARPTLVKKLSDLQQVMEARVLAVKHIQTLKVVLYKASISTTLSMPLPYVGTSLASEHVYHMTWRDLSGRSIEINNHWITWTQLPQDNTILIFPNIL